MSKTKQNIQKSKRGGYDLWGKRPMGGCILNSWSKRQCRRIERKRKWAEIRRELLSGVLNDI